MHSTIPPGVIVAGVGRSGTSMVTNALASCGWSLPVDRLIGANRKNPKGFFEDRRISKLHDDMLVEQGLRWNDVEELRRRRGTRLDIPPGCRDRVDALVAEYRAGPPWAWKNPRATLFLDAWGKLLPEATFLICVRHPAHVAQSLVRGGDVAKPGISRNAQIRRALSMWRSYNLTALAFLRSYEDRATVVRIPEDMPALDRAAAGVPEPTLLHTPPGDVRTLSALALPVLRLYAELKRLHDPAILDRLLEGLPKAEAGAAETSQTGSSRHLTLE
jgi:hypothetical protein